MKAKKGCDSAEAAYSSPMVFSIESGGKTIGGVIFRQDGVLMGASPAGLLRTVASSPITWEHASGLIKAFGWTLVPENDAAKLQLEKIK